MKKTELQSNLAMTITLVMGSMLFVTLFMGYAIYRTSAAVWPPLGIPKVSLSIPFISTLMIVLSSYFAYLVKMNVLKNSIQKADRYLNYTLGLGFGFLITQSYLWLYLKQTGVFLGSSGIFGSILYGFTWIHAIHVVLGVLSLVYLKFAFKNSKGNVSQKTINVEKFWHFLGVVWVIMFLTIFVL
jgi:cytochrome c oxidase subunit 3